MSADLEKVNSKYNLLSTGYSELKRSKFYCYIYYCDSMELFSKLKKDFFNLENGKYKHIVNVGYFSNKEIASDDKEVGNSSKKILFSLKKMNKKNVAVFIGRVFGGTLLGVGNVEKCFMASFKDACDKLGD